MQAGLSRKIDVTCSSSSASCLVVGSLEEGPPLRPPASPSQQEQQLGQSLIVAWLLVHQVLQVLQSLI